MSQKFSSKIYNAKKTFIVMFSIYLSLIGSLFVINTINGLPRTTIAIVFFIVMASMVISASLFIDKIKSFFTNNIDAILNNEFMKIIEYNQSGDEVKKEYEFYWHEINSYRYVFKDDIVFIFLNLSGGRKYNFAFRDNIDQEESTNDTPNLLTVFLSFIKNYNCKTTDHVIVPCMGFLNTKLGTILLWGLVVFFVIAFIIHLELKPNSSFITLLVAAITIISLITSKNNDKENYNRMINSD